MGSVGDCYDNAMCESFNATLECELIVQHNFKTQREVALAVSDCIEGWYNPKRRQMISLDELTIHAATPTRSIRSRTPICSKVSIGSAARRGTHAPDACKKTKLI